MQGKPVQGFAGTVNYNKDIIDYFMLDKYYWVLYNHCPRWMDALIGFTQKSDRALIFLLAFLNQL